VWPRYTIYPLRNAMATTSMSKKKAGVIRIIEDHGIDDTEPVVVRGDGVSFTIHTTVPLDTLISLASDFGTSNVNLSSDTDEEGAAFITVALEDVDWHMIVEDDDDEDVDDDD